MKKIASLILAVALVLCSMSAFADANMQKFQPYTSVDISSLESDGFTCVYDDMHFMAEFHPKTSKISWKIVDPNLSSFTDEYSITFDIKVIYSAGKATLVPRLILYRSGVYTYLDNRMDEVFIKNGENRYRIDVSGVSRSTNSKTYSATESVVEPMRISGLIMLKDIATSDTPITIRFNSLEESVHELTAEDRAAFVSFYNSCEKAGIFNQEYLVSYTDDYHILTLFNAGSEGTEEETPIEQADPADESGTEDDAA